MQRGRWRMKIEYGLYHGIVRCDDCEWKSESYKNAQALASKHAQKYGHRVEGDIGIRIVYDAREDGTK